MHCAIVIDAEFLTAENAMARMWCGPDDPDPVVVQIGLVRLGLDGDFPLLDRLDLHVVPRDRHGVRCALDPFFTRLTGVTEDAINRDGLPLVQALDRVRAFAGGARIWSWGKDELQMMAISCYVAGIVPPVPATQFGNATRLLLAAGVPRAEVTALRSNRLAAHFGVAPPDLRAHDALADALSVALALQHLLRQGLLAPAALA